MRSRTLTHRCIDSHTPTPRYTPTYTHSHSLTHTHTHTNTDHVSPLTSLHYSNIGQSAPRSRHSSTNQARRRSNEQFLLVTINIFGYMCIIQVPRERLTLLQMAIKSIFIPLSSRSSVSVLAFDRAYSSNKSNSTKQHLFAYLKSIRTPQGKKRKLCVSDSLTLSVFAKIHLCPILLLPMSFFTRVRGCVQRSA